MNIRITLAASEGKILTNGTDKEYMVNIYGENGEMPDVSEWQEIDEVEVK